MLTAACVSQAAHGFVRTLTINIASLIPGNIPGGTNSPSVIRQINATFQWCQCQAAAATLRIPCGQCQSRTWRHPHNFIGLIKVRFFISIRHFFFKPKKNSKSRKKICGRKSWARWRDGALTRFFIPAPP